MFNLPLCLPSSPALLSPLPPCHVQEFGCCVWCPRCQSLIELHVLKHKHPFKSWEERGFRYSTGQRPLCFNAALNPDHQHTRPPWHKATSCPDNMSGKTRPLFLSLSFSLSYHFPWTGWQRHNSCSVGLGNSTTLQLSCLEKRIKF